MVDIGVCRDVDGVIGGVERNAASHERRGRGACGRRAGQTRYPDDCKRELGHHRGGDEEGERDVSQVCGQVQRVDCFRLCHRRQSVVVRSSASACFLWVNRHEVYRPTRDKERRRNQSVLQRPLGVVCQGPCCYCCFLSPRILKDFSEQTAMNPFHTAHTPIRSAVFDSRVRASAKKNL
jgi:hypothetical protein